MDSSQQMTEKSRQKASNRSKPKYAQTGDELRPLHPLESSTESDELSEGQACDKMEMENGTVVPTAADSVETTREEIEEDIKCGYGGCKPGGLQVCNNPKALLFFLCIFSAVQGFVVNGVNNVNTTSIERRFHLPSSKVGLISSAYDISAAILGLGISYFGARNYKSRWLTMAAIVMALGSFIMTLPHFSTGRYEWGQNVTKGCLAEGDADLAENCESQSDSGLQNYLYVLILGQLLHGVGGTTLYTVGVSFIDDSVQTASSPFYIGIMYAFAALGPGIGYIVGGQLLSIYVDFDKIHESVPLDQDDPRWVGAWWLGFLAASMLFVTLIIPLAAYGKELPSARSVRETRVSQAHHSQITHKADREGFGRSIKDFPASLFVLLRNPPYMMITLAGASEGILTSGFATFMPKFIQNQFVTTAAWAALLSGLMAVPGAAGGQFCGGLICKKLDLKVKGMLRLSIMTCLIGAVLAASIWAKCEQDVIIGVNAQYTNRSEATLPSLVSSCNQNCSCSTEYYEPVCTAQGQQYFSPCHAGCTEESADGTKFENCSCLMNVAIAANMTSVTPGRCETGCSLMYMFLPFLFIMIFLTFVPGSPAVSSTLRCIHEKQRSFGLGLKWFVIRLLGSVPGPILFGVVIDSSCVIWQESCGEKAACWIYNNTNMSRNFFLITVAVKCTSSLFFFLAYKFYKPPPEAKNSDNDDMTFASTKTMSDDVSLSYIKGAEREGSRETVTTSL